jgi:hypothetical protein
MAFKLTPIKIKGRARDIPRIERAVKAALKEAADEAQTLLEGATATWKHKPTFSQTAVRDGIVIGTDDQIFEYVDDGTKPHIITPKRAKRLVFSPGGSPKTRPGVVGSGSGSRGDTRVFAKVVHHPGTAPRNFSKAVAKQMQDALPVIIAAHLGGELGD